MAKIIVEIEVPGSAEDIKAEIEKERNDKVFDGWLNEEGKIVLDSALLRIDSVDDDFYVFNLVEIKD
jgi:hypothetical protein